MVSQMVNMLGKGKLKSTYRVYDYQVKGNVHQVFEKSMSDKEKCWRN
jgi:hypothetical protein